MPPKTKVAPAKKGEIDLDHTFTKLFKELAENYEYMLTSAKEQRIEIDEEAFDKKWKQRIESKMNDYMQTLGLKFEFKDYSAVLKSSIDIVQKELDQNKDLDIKVRNHKEAYISRAKFVAESIDNMYGKIDAGIKGTKRTVKNKLEGRRNKIIDYFTPIKYRLAGILIAVVGIGTIATAGILAAYAVLPVGIAIPVVGAIMGAGMVIGVPNVIGSIGDAVGRGLYSISRKIKDYFVKDQTELEKSLRIYAGDLKSAAEKIKGMQTDLDNNHPNMKNEFNKTKNSHVEALNQRRAEEKAAKENGSPVRK
jgi:hypothetical protein